MSLSKPFRLSHLPLLPFENVLLLTEPKALLLFALTMSFEKTRELFGKFSLVKYVDTRVCDTAVIFTICFKSGKPVELKLELSNRSMRDGWRRTVRVYKLDNMRMVLWETKFDHPNILRCSLPKENFVDYTQRIGHLFQSICPGQRIRNLVAGKLGWKDEKVLFHWDRITRCDNFTFVMYNGDNLLEILKKTDVKRKIYLVEDREEDPNLEWMNNEKIRNIPNLQLADVKNLSDAQFLSLDNEHLDLFHCSVNGSVLNAFLKKWMNGEFTKRRTLKLSDWSYLFDGMIDGLTQEPVGTWEKLGTPELVRFSDELYLNPTPRTVPDEYQTVLLKNCRGQFATVIRTRGASFYFTPWDHPLPPIEIPEGHKLCESSDWPLVMIVPQNYEIPD